jgi:hypothetical protein
MTQDQIESRSPREYDLQLRRHLIASLRIVECRLEMQSSLKPEIGKRKEHGS